ncbi:methyltransferase [Candidatus Curculioniphilus buchneri]
MIKTLLGIFSYKALDVSSQLLLATSNQTTIYGRIADVGYGAGILY